MREPPPAELLAALWPPAGAAGEVYAVLDGAREPLVESTVLVSGLPQASLFGETTSPEVRQVSPHLVQLEPGGETSALIAGRAWARGWGIFALAPAGTGFRKVERHLRRLLRAVDERGTVMLFRYYDPRAIHLVWPTFSSGQVEQALGPLSAFLYRAPGTDTLVRLPPLAPRRAAEAQPA